VSADSDESDSQLENTKKSSDDYGYGYDNDDDDDAASDDYNRVSVDDDNYGADLHFDWRCSTVDQDRSSPSSPDTPDSGESFATD